MDDTLRTRFIRDIIADLEQVSGARFESMGGIVLNELADIDFLNRGVNIGGAPVGGITDSVAPLHGEVGEYSSQADYFNSPFKKLLHDTRHAHRQNPEARRIHLFSSRLCGPSASARLFGWIARVKKCSGIEIELYDARRIAEIIVDKFLLCEATLQRLIPYLPNVRRIYEIFAATYLLPPQDQLYRGRVSDEDAVIGRLNITRALAITGIGGIGKSEFACSIAHRIKGQFEMILWVPAEEIRSFEDLHGIDVRRSGYSLNLVGLLREHRSLLILDNLVAEVAMDRLAAASGNKSAILVTKQNKLKNLEYVFELGPLHPGPDEEVLNEGVVRRCPASTLATIRKTVGGHPLVLRIINADAKDGVPWKDLERDCVHAGDFEGDCQRVADRILARHAGVLRSELNFLAWCDTPLLDRGLVVHILGEQGIIKLERRSFLARAPSHVVRVHDIVFASVRANSSVLLVDASHAARDVAEYVESVAASKGLALFRVVHRHRDLFARSVHEQGSQDPLLYAYLLGNDPTDLDASVLPDPIESAKSLPEDRNYSMRLAVIVETIEKLYRRTRQRESPAAAKRELEGRLSVFIELMDSGSLTPEQVSFVRHHYAKSLLKLNRAAEARQQFEALLHGPRVMPATKLQLVRLYTDMPHEAKRLVEEILDEEQKDPESIPVSVFIETVESFRRQHLAKFLPELTEKYSTLIASRLKAAACSGFDHPLIALAGVSQHWAYHNPGLLLEIVEELPSSIPTEDMKDEDRFTMGEILKAAGKARQELGEQDAVLSSRDLFEQAGLFYSAITLLNAYQARGAAENEILRKRYESARQILAGVPEPIRDRFWRYRMAQVEHGVGNNNSAIAEIEKALAGERDKYTSALLDLRSDIRRSLADPNWAEDLREAIKICGNEKYRVQLERKIAGDL